MTRCLMYYAIMNVRFNVLEKHRKKNSFLNACVCQWVNKAFSKKKSFECSNRVEKFYISTYPFTMSQLYY